MTKLIKNLLVQFAGLSNTSRKTVSDSYKIIFLRHGQCEWDKKNLFCGWYNSPLTEQGRDEAKRAAKVLCNCDLRLHHGFTSNLCRSIETMEIILREIDQEDITVDHSWRLNERHYGNLTGMHKHDATELFGAEKIDNWRKSYSIRPPPILNVNPFYRDVMHAQAKDVVVPEHESLQDTLERGLVYWDTVIASQVSKGKTVLIVAHEHFLRAMLKHIEIVPDDGAQYLSVPAGVPFMYVLDGSLRASQDVADVLRFFGSSNDKRAVKMRNDLDRAKNPIKYDEERRSCKN